eukprot:363421-Chlamydomonas_euryale.AAC.1
MAQAPSPRSYPCMRHTLTEARGMSAQLLHPQPASPPTNSPRAHDPRRRSPRSIPRRITHVNTMISARTSSRGGAAVAGTHGRAAAAPRVAHQRWPVSPRGSVAARVANVTQDSFEAEVLKVCGRAPPARHPSASPRDSTALRIRTA